MFDCISKELIISNIALRGKGDSSKSPVRRVTQIFEKDGTLVAERDTFGGFTLEQMFDFAEYCQGKSSDTSYLFEEWKNLPTK